MPKLNPWCADADPISATPTAPIPSTLGGQQTNYVAQDYGQRAVAAARRVRTSSEAKARKLHPRDWPVPPRAA